MTDLIENPLQCQVDRAWVEQDWFKRQSSKVLIFYGYPLIRKWTKTFKSPSLLVICEKPIDLTPWQKQFKARSTHWMPLSDAIRQVGEDHGCYELVVVLQKELSQEEFLSLSALLCKGGAFLLYTRNLHQQWSAWQTFLDKADLVQLFPTGFHPTGAVAWWPFLHPWCASLGLVIEFLMTFFPGRYPLGLYWGKCWVVSGLKRDDITLLS